MLILLDLLNRFYHFKWFHRIPGLISYVTRSFRIEMGWGICRNHSTHQFESLPKGLTSAVHFPMSECRGVTFRKIHIRLGSNLVYVPKYLESVTPTVLCDHILTHLLLILYHGQLWSECTDAMPLRHLILEHTFTQSP